MRTVLSCVIFLGTVLGVVGATTLDAQQPTEKIQVVATIPDLAEFARRIGGEFVDVKSLATGVENIHAVPMKPSFVKLLNRADMVVLLGLDAEHAFLPALLEASRNARILRDGPGYIDCSKYVKVLDVPTRIDRSQGDQHPMGNPHYNLDPVAMQEAARAIAEGFAANHPEHEGVFKENLKKVVAEFDKNMERWEREAAPLKGRKLVSYHPDIEYLAARFHMEVAGTIELRPGIDPTPGHVEELIARMRKEKVDFVVRELNYPAALAETVAKRSGAALVELPSMVGGVPQAKDYAGLVDYNLQALLKALPKGDVGGK